MVKETVVNRVASNRQPESRDGEVNGSSDGNCK